MSGESMEKRTILALSYEETVYNLLEYHKAIMREVHDNFKFPNVSVTPFIALRKNVELVCLGSSLIEWEQDVVFQCKKKHIFEEYYPLILDFMQKKTIPKKCRDYCCDIDYFYIFPPIYYKNTICRFFVNFFEKPIFKKFNSMHI